MQNESTAYDIIKKFDEMYLKQSTALQIICRNRLEKIRLKDYDEIDTFFSEFEKLVNDLKSAGANVSEREKLNYMLNTLPESYSYIGDLIDVLKEEEQTVEYVKNKTQMSEMKTKKDENMKKKSNAFMAESEKKKSEVICHNCGRAGHYKRECYYNSKSGNNEQWKKAQSARGRGGAARGNFRRGAWRGCAGFRGNSSSQTSSGYQENQQDSNNA